MLLVVSVALSGFAGRVEGQVGQVPDIGLSQTEFHITLRPGKIGWVSFQVYNYSSWSGVLGVSTESTGLVYSTFVFLSPAGTPGAEAEVFVAVGVIDSEVVPILLINEDGKEAARATVYATVENPLPIPLAVVDAGTSRIVSAPDTVRTQGFTVKNVGGSSKTFVLSHHCSPEVTGCLLLPTSLTLAPGASGSAMLRYTVGGLGTPMGTVEVTATPVSEPARLGKWVLQVSVEKLEVTPGSGVATGVSGGAGSLLFQVKNRGTTSGVFDLEAVCAGGPAQGCVVTPGAVTLAPGDSATATLTYTGGEGTGTVQLKAKGRGALAGIEATGAYTLSVAAGVLSVELETLNPGTEVTRSLCLNISAGAGAAYECGDLRLAHGLPVTTAMNIARAPTLLYNSQHASPVPVVAANVLLPTGVTLTGQSLTAVLKVAGTERANTSWSLTGWSAGQARRIALGFDASALATGVYDYTLEVKLGNTSYQQTKSGKLVVVNRSASPYGAGWWVAGVEQLVASGSSWLWIGGDGSTRLYQPTTPSNITKWVAINPDRSADTLSLASSQYTRRLPDKTQVLFDATGRQNATISRLGQRTDFTYDSSGRLTAIKLAAPTETLRQSYTISWGTGTYTVTAPGSRATVVTLGSGRVTGIKDPDNQSIQFGYATTTSRLVTRRTDKLGVITTYGYTVEGSRLAAVVADSGAARLNIRTAFTPSEVRGLRVGNGTGLTAVALTEAMTLINGPRTDTTVTRIWTDRYGAPTVIRDALGAETTLIRGDARFPALVTEAQAPNGYTTRAAFDARGNPVQITAVNPYGDGRDAVTLYEYADASNPFLPTKVTEPEGEVTRYSYLSNGNVAWQQPGEDTTRRWSYSYNGNGQLTAADPPGPPAAELLEYDERGNLKSSSTSMGFKTSYVKDALGRDTSVVQPAVGTSTLRQSIRYDAMGRVLSTRDIGVGGGITMWTSVTHTYDINGNRTQSRVWGRSGTADSIPGGTSSWTYDRMGRVLVNRTPASVGDTLSYDAAGNVLRMASPGGDVVFMTYDALNRVSRRVIPTKSYATEFISAYPGDTIPWMLQGASTQGWQFPVPAFSPGGLTIPADTQSYTFDPSGNLLTANNRYARVSRSYYPGGALKTDSSAIRDYSGTGFSTYRYGLSFSYDRDGRRIQMQHPSVLSTGTTAYQYYATTGELQTITDPNGTPYTYNWNVNSLPTGIQTPAGTDDLTWDNDGRLTELAVLGIYGKGMIESYDAMGRRTKSTTYDALGSVTKATQWDTRGALRLRLTEDFTRDPFGNALSSLSYTPEDINVQSGLPHTQVATYLEGGRITSRTEVWAVKGMVMPDGYVLHRTSWKYDVRGNLERVQDISGPTPAARSVSRNYYGADGKLMVSQINRDSLKVTLNNYIDKDHNNHPFYTVYNPEYSNWGAYEEYWYDALGRRILKRTRRESPVCQYNGRCVSAIERVVWDGDEILWELRDQNLAGPANPPAGTQTGKIGYIHGIAIDAPLGMIRNGTRIVLHRNTRGQYLMGTPLNGTIDTDIIWPAAYWSVQEEFHLIPMPNPYRVRSWYGSLIFDQTDATGLQYKRNRYYSPVSGQFTQPDPIGIAGGLNVYGYATGDPVNFKDPFGLDKCPKDFSVFECTGWTLMPAQRPLEIWGTLVTMPLSGGMGMLGEAAAITRLGLVAAEARSLSAANSFFEGAAHSETVIEQLGKVDDMFHTFPQSVDGFASAFGRFSTRVGGDGQAYQHLQMAGKYGAKTGVFEYIKDGAGLITHRFFRPY
ncbi:MAG: hypothetical protein LBG44_06315 [Gemmatimonadota bacterium]|nr:hypothetical protein [Gemmatimonadota bacterium]